MTVPQVLQVGLLAWVTWTAWQISRSARACRALDAAVLRDFDEASGLRFAGALERRAAILKLNLSSAQSKTLERAFWLAAERETEWSRLYMLKGVGRLIPTAALLAIVVELGWGLAGGSGLMALQAGLPQRVAFGHALTSLALALVSGGLHAWLLRRAQLGLRAAERES